MCALFLLLPTLASASPITLSQAFEAANKSSPELETARQRILRAEINVARAWALLKPVWTANLTYTHSEPGPEPQNIPVPDLQTVADNRCRDPMTGDPDITEPGCLEGLISELQTPTGQITLGEDFANQDVGNFSTRITWTPLNGAALPRIASAKDAVRLEGARAQALKRDQMLAVARAYYAAVASKDAIKAAGGVLKRARSRADVNRSKAALGGESEARVKASNIAARQAELDVERAKNAYQQSLLGLAFIAGLPEARDVVAPPEPKRPEQTADALIEMGLKRRENIEATRVAVRIADRRKDDAWWKFAPTVGFFSGLRASTLGGLSGQKVDWTIGIAANLTLYDAGLRYQDLRDADHELRIAQLSLKRAERVVRRDIQLASLRIKSARIAIDRAQQTLELANERVRTVGILIAAGTGREIELNEAYDQVADAERLIIGAKLDRALAVLQLRHAAGILVSDT